MGIIHVAEAPSSPTASRTLDGKKYVRTFNVESDSLLDGPYIVRNAPGIPNFGDSYAFGNESDSTSVALQIDSTRAGPHSKLWTVTVTYTQPTDKQNPQVDKFTLVDRSWDGMLVTRYVDKDLAGKLRRNSAGDPFDPPPPLEYTRHILRVKKNVPQFDPAIIVYYSNAINSDWFYNWPPGYARLMPIRKTEQSDVMGQIMVNYDSVEFEVHFDPFGWKTEYLDMGMRESFTVIGAAAGTKAFYQIKDDEHAFVTAPVMLDGNGRRQRDPAAAPTYIPFDDFNLRPFSPLGL